MSIQFLSEHTTETYIPHVGWLLYPAGDDVALFLRQGWFEFDLQTFLFLYLRPGDTFVDCGAHAGLYSVLAGKLIGPQGTLVSVEPNPAVCSLLRRNLESNGIAGSVIAEAAAYSASGTMKFYPGREGRTAYGSLMPEDELESFITVATTTVGELCRGAGVVQADVVKLDVEGSEIEAVRGLTSTARDISFPLLIVEFTEANLKRANSGTELLYSALEAAGYRICRFDSELRQLVPVPYEGVIWHANYVAVLSPEDVNTRLSNAPSDRLRIAREIASRGEACNLLYMNAEAGQSARSALNRTVDQLDEAYKRVGEANWRADRAHQREQDTLARLDEAYKRVGEANWRADQAYQREREALARLLDEELAKTVERAGRMENMIERLGELFTRTQERAERDATASLTGELTECRRMLGETRCENDYLRIKVVALEECLSLLRARSHEIASSRYVKFGRALGILKALWLDNPDAGLDAPASTDDSMTVH